MAEATTLRVRVSPGAARTEVVGPYGDAWKLRVASPAEGGRANDAVVALLADTLGLRRGDVRIRSGHAARDKVVALRGLDGAEAARRLAAGGVA